MIPSGDTWGISGPTFLLAYLVLALAVGAAVLRARRALADVSAIRPASRMEERPYDVAYLNGDAQLALTAALSAMYRAGTIKTAGRGVRHRGGAAGLPGGRAQRAIHHAAVTGPVTGAPCPRSGGVASALHRVEQRLIAAGLLLAAERRRRIRLAGGWVLAVAVFGVVRVMAGYANDRPVGFLTILVVLVTFLGVLLAGTAPRRTRAGDALLRQLAAPSTTRCRRRRVPTGRTTARRALRSPWASSGGRAVDRGPGVRHRAGRATDGVGVLRVHVRR